MITDNTIYKKIDFYNTKSTEGKIKKLDQIIDSLFEAQIKLADENLGIKEYSIDTGQTVHKVQRDTMQGVFTLIQNYEKLRTMYKNRLLSPMTKLVDGKNLNRNTRR